MGTSIGELFVKLGFDVDDAKLKDFAQSIEGVYGGIMKFASVAGATVGFTEMVKGAEQTAISIEKLTAVYGVSAKAIQAWGAVVHETWPDVSYANGIQGFGKVAEYLKNAAFTPQGAMALNLLGIQNNASDLQHPEKVLGKLFDTIPILLAQHPEKRAFYSQQIGTITGDPANISIFERGRAAADLAASHTGLYQSELDTTVKVARDISALQDQWDRFVGHAVASVSQGVLNLEGHIDNAQKKDPGALGFLEGVWDWAKTDPYDLPGLGRGLIHNSIMDRGVSATSNWIQGVNEKANARGTLKKLGWSDDQTSGIMKRLMIESDMNPGAVGDNGQAYGIAQWHPDRQREFAKWAGHGIRGSSVEEQLQFMNYELTKGNERSAGNKLRKTQNEDDAYRVFTNEYERPAVTVHVTQNIHSNDPEVAGRAAANAIQETVTSASLNRMQEPY